MRYIVQTWTGSGPDPTIVFVVWDRQHELVVSVGSDALDAEDQADTLNAQAVCGCARCASLVEVA